MKVVYLDSWTKGIHNFLRIDGELKARGAQTLLIHKGSWGYETRPREEIIDGLLVRDISFYKTNFIYNALKKEKPDVVLMLTTNYIADRAAILACRALGIKSVFLMHGIRIIDKEEIKKMLSIIKYKNLLHKLQRVWIYLRNPVPNYLYSRYKLFGGKGILDKYPYKILWNTFINSQKWIHYPEPSNELHCDLALVWGKAYAKYCIEFFGYPEGKVKVVGHPTLDPVFKLKNKGLSDKEKKYIYNILDLDSRSKFCVYLEEALVEAKFNGWSNESRIKHLKEIAYICKSAGYKLVIKLHPATVDSNIFKIFKNESHVRVIKEIDLHKLIYISDFVIGHLSTTLDIAIVLGKPILYPNWGISANLTSHFLKKGLVISCVSPTDMICKMRSIDNISKLNLLNIEMYIDEYITYTDGKSVKRIVDNIYALLKQE